MKIEVSGTDLDMFEFNSFSTQRIPKCVEIHTIKFEHRLIVHHINHTLDFSSFPKALKNARDKNTAQIQRKE